MLLKSYLKKLIYLGKLRKAALSATKKKYFVVEEKSVTTSQTILENSSVEILAQEAAIAVIDQFDPRACAIYLIYCAEAASLNKPLEENFVIDDRQLLEYTGLVKRRDLNRNEQFLILSNLLRQPAQVAARIVWPKQGKVEAFTVADLQIWEIAVLQNFETAQDGSVKLTGLKSNRSTWCVGKIFPKQPRVLSANRSDH